MLTTPIPHSSPISLFASLTLLGIGISFVSAIVLTSLSSLTSDSRLVTFGWLAICFIPIVAQQVIHEIVSGLGEFGMCISPRDCYTYIVHFVLDVPAAWEAAGLKIENGLGRFQSRVEVQYPLMTLGGVALVAATHGLFRSVTFSRRASNQIG